MQSHPSNQSAKTPASACRIPIFSPTRRPAARTTWQTDTPWGAATITGRLGQQHRDLLDAARMVAEAEEWTTDGRLHLKIDPARLRSAVGGDGVNQQRIQEWLRDLMQSIVTVKINSPSITITGGLISDVVEAACAPPTSRPGAISTGRRYLRISFGLAWSKLIEDDFTTKYPLRQVVALKHGFSQAVARYCLSHRFVIDDVASLMQKLGAGGELRKRRGELAADSTGLAALGIIIAGDKIRGAGSKVPVTGSKVPVTGSKVPVKTRFYQYDQ